MTGLNLTGIKGKNKTDSVESERHKGEKMKLTVWNLTGIKGKS